MSLKRFLERVKEYSIFKEHPKDTAGKDLDTFTSQLDIRYLTALNEFKIYKCFYTQHYSNDGLKKRYVTYDDGEFKLIDLQVNGYFQRSKRVMNWREICLSSSFRNGFRILDPPSFSKPWNFKQILSWILNFIKRIFHNEGCIIVLLGPDGVGKTTNAKNVVKKLKCAFNTEYAYFGWGDFSFLTKLVYKFKKAPNSSQSGKGNTDFKHTLYYYLEMWLRFIPLKFKARFLGRIYVLDRYFYDNLINQRHPGFWKMLIPKPDYTFILVADPSEIIKRKPELTKKEINNLYQKYVKLPSVTLINASGSIKKTTRSITDTLALNLINKKEVLE